MNGHQFIQSIRISNLLSFGPNPGPEGFKLEPLNVLIGPNASGKSNLIETISILAATPRDLTKAFEGGITNWLWKGVKINNPAEIEIIVNNQPSPIRYNLTFNSINTRLQIILEEVEDSTDDIEKSTQRLYYKNSAESDKALIFRRNVGTKEPEQIRSVSRAMLSSEQSVLSQRKDKDTYPELTDLGQKLGNIRLYREWSFGRDTAPRSPQRADLPVDFLLEDASNLALVINNLINDADTKLAFIQQLKRLYERVEDVQTKVVGGTVQIYFHEKGLKSPVPATRLSDGTLRYLCLLSILCHPTPPPLVCIEEPELGLHPDVIPDLAKLLIEASQRTQLIITTHSETLVSELSSVPESIVICERSTNGTVLRRLEQDKLTDWLEKYRLGELWRMGEIGGNR